MSVFQQPFYTCFTVSQENPVLGNCDHVRGAFFYVRREVDLMKTAKVNAYIMHIFGKIELLSIHAI